MPILIPPHSGLDNNSRSAAIRSKTGQKRNRQKMPQQKQNIQPGVNSLYFRLMLVWGILIAGTIGLSANLYRLQIVEAPRLLQKARQQQLTYLQPFIPRRPIIDRNNNVLAIERPVYTLYAHPKLFTESKAAIALELAKVLERPSTKLIEQFNTRASGIQIATAIPEETADKIKNLKINKSAINGLELIQSYSRFYPQQNLVADVIGYVNRERQGQAGVEYSQRKLLERPIKNLRILQTANRALMSADVPPGFVHTDDLQLQLTIDSRLQRAVRLRLKQQIQKFHAKRGSVIVMDARDGSILSLVSEPSYDPNKYYQSDIKTFKNWALADLYEPGSTFKPVNVAIALEAGAVQANTIFPDPDVIKVGGWSIRNAERENHRALSVAGILQYSSNVGMVQVMQRMQPAEYYKWLKRIGLGQAVGVDLPFEAVGQLKSQKQFVSSPIEPATTSFGQGFSLTPIQLVQMHGALANGGKLVTPHVVRGLVNAKGEIDSQPKLPANKSVFSPQTTKTVLDMMETVVKQGTGKAAQIPGYRIGGKTGTAQKASPNGGYLSNAKITSFVSIFPIESPRYVVLAVVDEPTKGIIFGSTVAAPVVKSVMEALITIEKIPPSQPFKTEVKN